MRGDIQETVYEKVLQQTIDRLKGEIAEIDRLKGEIAEIEVELERVRQKPRQERGPDK